MAASWPATIAQQQFSDTGWSETPRPTVIRSSVDVGLPKTRRRFTTTIVDVTASVLLDKNGPSGNEVTAFWTFWNTTLAGGSLPFEMTHPFTGTTVEYSPVGDPQFSAEGPTTVRVTMQLTRVA